MRKRRKEVERACLFIPFKSYRATSWSTKEKEREKKPVFVSVAREKAGMNFNRFSQNKVQFFLQSKFGTSSEL